MALPIDKWDLGVPRASGDKPQATFTAGQKQDVFPAPAGMNHHITRYLFLKFLY
ncbi:hypothetical protein ACRWEZ_15150 [Escherichia coli]